MNELKSTVSQSPMKIVLLTALITGAIWSAISPLNSVTETSPNQIVVTVSSDGLFLPISNVTDAALNSPPAALAATNVNEYNFISGVNSIWNI